MLAVGFLIHASHVFTEHVLCASTAPANRCAYEFTIVEL